MGFRLASHKERGPSQRIEGCGHILDFAEARVLVKEERFQEITAEISAILSQASSAPQLIV